VRIWEGEKVGKERLKVKGQRLKVMWDSEEVD
jgi:hypothetical protein